MSSTTHITEWLRFSLAQISQRYVRNVVARGTEFHFAAQLCQGFRQKRRLLFGLFEQVQHQPGAVRFPIPGNCDISCTARSNNFEENSMAQR
jgi:hypothetical protein